MTDRGNLLILMSDEQAPWALGCLGRAPVDTPHLDRLAAQGTVFTQAYTNSPICVSARAALQTGRYVHQIGCWDSAQPYRGQPKGWAHDLRSAGATAVSVGKLHFGSSAEDNGFEPEILPLHVKDGLGWLPGLLRRPLGSFPAAAELAAPVGPGVSPYHDYDRKVAARSAAWLTEEAPRDRPWTLLASFVSPHYPLVAPPSYFERYAARDLPPPTPPGATDHPALARLLAFFDYDRHFTEEGRRQARIAYYGLVSFLDGLVGQVLQGLEASGQHEKTTILFLSDHGEMLGNQGIWAKSVMFEDSLGIPMILAGPGLPKGKQLATPVSLVDVAPTALRAVLLSNDATGPGRALQEIAREDEDPNRPLFAEYHDGGSDTGIFAYRRGRWKLVHYEGERPQLFDLKTDPQELNDLGASPAHRETIAALTAGLREIVEPSDADARAFADQADLIDRLGGRAAVEARTQDLGFNFSPPPRR